MAMNLCLKRECRAPQWANTSWSLTLLCICNWNLQPGRNSATLNTKPTGLNKQQFLTNLNNFLLMQAPLLNPFTVRKESKSQNYPILLSERKNMNKTYYLATCDNSWWEKTSSLEVPIGLQMHAHIKHSRKEHSYNHFNKQYKISNSVSQNPYRSQVNFYLAWRSLVKAYKLILN